MREHANLPTMMGFVRKHVAQHLDANRPWPRPAVSAKVLDATIAAERFPEHLRTASGTLGQCCARLLRRTVCAIELPWNLQVWCCEPYPLAADVVHVGEDRGNGPRTGFARVFPCRRLCFPYSRIKTFDEHLVDAVVQQKHSSAGVLHVTKLPFC